MDSFNTPHVRNNLHPSVDLIITALHFPTPQAKNDHLPALIQEIETQTGLKKRRIVGNLNRLPHTHFVLGTFVDAFWAENVAKRLAFLGAEMYVRYSTHNRYEERRE